MLREPDTYKTLSMGMITSLPLIFPAPAKHGLVSLDHTSGSTSIGHSFDCGHISSDSSPSR